MSEQREDMTQSGRAASWLAGFKRYVRNLRRDVEHRQADRPRKGSHDLERLEVAETRLALAERRERELWPES